MKLKHIAASLLLGASLSTAAQAQSPFKLEVEQNVVDTTLFVDFFIQRTAGTDFALGSSNFAVYMTHANLDLSKMQKVDSANGVWDISYDPASYREMGLGGTGTFINLTVKRLTSGSGSGQVVSELRRRVGRVAVPITNRCGTNTAEWIIAPVAITNFAGQSIKSQANFVAPPANRVLCATPAAPQVAASGATSLCEGQNVELSANVSGSVQWYLDGQPIAGATSPTLTVNQSGNYTAQAINCSCTNNSTNAISVEMSSKPAIPALTSVADTLFASASANYQWYLDGVAIEGANSPKYVPTSSGTYTVGTSNQCGISYSEAIVFNVTGIGSTASAVALKAYPNPFREQTQISYTLSRKGAVKIEVMNTLGQQVKTLVDEIQTAGAHKVIFAGAENELSAGSYFVKVQAEGKTEILKLVQAK